MSPTVAPYGTWASPITPALLTEATVSLSQLQVWGGRVWWNEGRPSEAGRQVVVAADLDGGEASDRIPAGFSARTQVHEYGGSCFAGRGEQLVWSNWTDQRLWTAVTGGEPEPLTAEPDSPRATRFADPVVSPDGRWLACVRERHRPDEVVNDLVVIALDGPPGAEPRVLTAGRDFYAAPRFSPAGNHLAWLSWDHPDMPWDHTDLHEAGFSAGTIGASRHVAGRDGESVTQPRWSPSGLLHYISDRRGWYNLYADGGIALAPLDAEFSQPDWVFGQSSYAFLPDGRLVATWSADGPAQLGVLGAAGMEPLALPFSSYSSLAPTDGAVFAIAASPTRPPAVVRIEIDTAEVTVVRASRQAPVDASWLARPQPIEFASAGETAHVWYYPPTNPDFAPPPGEIPPVIVISHGGPTSSASPVLNVAVQYWTSRGFAVVDVDYRGSSGYGRTYRDRLRGEWGVIDVEDCANVVGALADRGLADPARAVIRGGSAGGFTTLAALAFTDVFAAGGSHYGVADLELLARDTHKFESCYLDGLVGAWPAQAVVYAERSPLHHLDTLRCPVILFQGEDDAIVPRAQADAIYAALADRGVLVEYHLYPGEQHGFRQSTTIEAVARAELAFYGRVLGFVPADA